MTAAAAAGVPPGSTDEPPSRSRRRSRPSPWPSPAAGSSRPRSSRTASRAASKSRVQELRHRRRQRRQRGQGHALRLRRQAHRQGHDPHRTGGSQPRTAAGAFMEAIDGGHWRAQAKAALNGFAAHKAPVSVPLAACPQSAAAKACAPCPDLAPAPAPRRRPAPASRHPQALPAGDIPKRHLQTPWSLRQAGRQPDCACALGRRRALAHKSTLPSISAMPEPADSGRQGRRGFPRPRGERPALPAQLKIYRCVENTLPTKEPRISRSFFPQATAKPRSAPGFAVLFDTCVENRPSSTAKPAPGDRGNSSADP